MWRFLGSFIVLRLVFVFFMDLMPQDAYYYFYGENLSLSYYDHPPMIAYILRLFGEIFGKHAISVKLADFVVSCMTLFMFYKLSSMFLSQKRVVHATVLIGSTFMLTILSLISTPDVPLLLFWTVTLFFLFKALQSNSLGYWLLGGISMGLAFDSKYTALLLPLGLLGFLLISEKNRKNLVRPGFYLAMLAFAITILPVFIWNYENDFASFKFQSSSRAESGLEFTPRYILGVLGHQSAIVFPFIFFFLIYLIWRVLRKYKLRFAADSRRLFVPVVLFRSGFYGISAAHTSILGQTKLDDACVHYRNHPGRHLF